MILLRGRRIRLRPPEPNDLKDFFRWINDHEASGEFDVFGITSWSEVEKWFKQPSMPYEFSPLVIERIQDKTKLGLAFRYYSHPVLSQFEIGLQIWNPRERNRGYGSEAAALMVDYIFCTKNVSRIQATSHVLNKPAHRMLEKCGFTREGRLRSALFTNGELYDAYVYGITRRKWKLLRNNGNGAQGNSKEGWKRHSGTLISPRIAVAARAGAAIV